MAAGQCTHDPVTGIAGIIYDAFIVYLVAKGGAAATAAAAFAFDDTSPGENDPRGGPRRFIASLFEPLAVQLDSGLAPAGAAGGDLSGTYPDPSVAKVRGRAVKDAAPNDADVLTWVTANARWEPLPGGSGAPIYTVASKAAGFSAATGYHYEVDTTGGSVAVTLPAAASGEHVRVIKIVAANQVTFAGGSIDGDASAYLDAGRTGMVEVMGLGGTSWRRVDF